ncbi:MAG: putative ATP-binding protein [Streblomastix strix]|uniref:histidine kinase n=1 Tax=Streblomastix strix TaxID=222440 RepID=A0A5J4WZS3_9EUKA|nr:MAG: putative ATP-binding protein [Streblomastix strix]
MSNSISTAGGNCEEKGDEIQRQLNRITWFFKNLHQGRNAYQPSFQPLPFLARIAKQQIEEEGANEEVEAQLVNKGKGQYNNIKDEAIEAKREILNNFIHSHNARPFWYNFQVGDTGTITKIISFEKDIQLTEEEKARLIFHSFTNLLNVLLDVIGKCRVCLNMIDGGIFDETMKLISSIGKSLTSIPDTIAQLHRLPFLKEKIVAEIKQAKLIFTEFEKSRTSSSSAAKNISKQLWKDIHYIEQTLLPIFDIRTKELTQRLSYPDNAWVMYQTKTLLRNMQTILIAVAQGSSNVSGIAFSETQRIHPSDMVVEAEYKGLNEGTIHFPPVFQDVMRDLIMNARKYSFPGGVINAKMINDGSKLTIEVKDHGMGIEEDEIQNVIEYGVRGSNAANRRTLGGGFGLTKAYYFSKQFNGSFTVKSAVGVGSTFTITIPCPTQFHVILPMSEQERPISAERTIMSNRFDQQKSALTAAPHDSEKQKQYIVKRQRERLRQKQLISLQSISDSSASTRAEDSAAAERVEMKMNGSK